MAAKLAFWSWLAHIQGMTKTTSKTRPDTPDFRFDDEGLSPPQPDQGKSPAEIKEHGGSKGPEPTRFGDWEKAGRCTDF